MARYFALPPRLDRECVAVPWPHQRPYALCSTPTGSLLRARAANSSSPVAASFLKTTGSLPIPPPLLLHLHLHTCDFFASSQASFAAFIAAIPSRIWFITAIELLSYQSIPFFFLTAPGHAAAYLGFARIHLTLFCRPPQQSVFFVRRLLQLRHSRASTSSTRISQFHHSSLFQARVYYWGPASLVL